jgi:hypothetical protein
MPPGITLAGGMQPVIPAWRLHKGSRAANAVAADGRQRLDGVIGWSRICAVAGGAADGRPRLSRFFPLEPGSGPRLTGADRADIPGGASGLLARGLQHPQMGR